MAVLNRHFGEFGDGWREVAVLGERPRRVLKSYPEPVEWTLDKTEYAEEPQIRTPDNPLPKPVVLASQTEGLLLD
ncbi:hypothetical protein AVEN_114758-1 [Araneus ventricosus]|uniref:Uncharacterized protein n=1 Tax=Araneus ventricosus TaxID=182803 RepID=A0A4Y2WJG3_ARAVE|nr:hypothetical protein AVEN_96331-1 [Araneus ventricosus]GBO37158.1 hypothetical protein AVEN_10863-1 [Araneus ventricosus]GBO37170.1 hypothetical protein AVEN_58595-1 [Araneus ventricosus]GBO37181.1 hypothetical protein AVEN_114758-1 [Araneus ventricosus]